MLVENDDITKSKIFFYRSDVIANQEEVRAL